MPISIQFTQDPVKQQRRAQQMQQEQLQQNVPSAADALYRLQAIQRQLGGRGLGQGFGIGPLTEAGALQQQANSLAGLLANPVTSAGTQPAYSNFLQSQLMPQQPPELTAAQKNFQFMQSLPEDQRDLFTQFAGSPRTEVNVGQSEYGTIPQNYQLKRDDNGNLRMEIIPGSPAERELTKEQQNTQKKQLLGKVGNDIVNDDINRAINIVNTSSLPVTGLGGNWLKSIPGTQASNLNSLLDTVRANVSFDKLQRMREASPTGGALGQVSDFENKLLQNTYANLEQSQTKDQFLYNLNRLKETFNLIVHGTATPTFNNQFHNEAAPMDASKREKGKVYYTPKGNLKWTGTGWVQP